MVSVQSNRGGHAAFMEGAPMLDATTFIGLDVHARSIKAVSLDVIMPPRACGGLSRGARRCSRAGSTATRRTWPRRASSPAGCGRSASWPRRRRGGGPPHISRSPRKRFDPKPLRRTSGPFSASAQGATRVHRLSVRRRSLSRSNGLPSERSPRADIKLQRRASVRHAEVAADGLI